MPRKNIYGSVEIESAQRERCKRIVSQLDFPSRMVSETQICVQVVYLGGHPRKHAGESDQSERGTKEKPVQVFIVKEVTTNTTDG